MKERLVGGLGGNLGRAMLRVAVTGAACLLLAFYALGTDEDGDGVPDVFERFFGLAVGADDSTEDPDGDGLDNLAESAAGTDPFSADTDLDGWDDGEDADPVSRAVYLWGDPRFTYGATNLYTRPAWASFGLADGGEPFTGGAYAYGWLLDTADDRLLMSIDRTLLSNDLWLAVAASGLESSPFMASVLDSNLVALTEPVALGDAFPPWQTNRLPLSAWPGASVIALHSAEGGAAVAVSVLYEDSDGDGLDDAQNAQLDSGDGEPPEGLPPAVGGGAEGPGSQQDSGAGEWIGFETVEGYEAGSLDGQMGWEATEGVDVSDADACEGLQSMVLRRNAPGGTDSRAAEKEVGAAFADGSVAWCSLRQRCVPNGPRLPREQIGAAAFVTDEAGHVVAYDGASGEWVVSERAFPGLTGVWARIDFRLDYAAKTYTLCFQGVAVHRDIGFADTALARPNGFYMRSDSSHEGSDAMADAIAFSVEEPAGLDFDGDGLSNADERAAGTDEWNADTDGDGLDDFLEIALGLDPLQNNGDYDGDGIPNGDELVFGTNPVDPDSDGDGIPDGYVVIDLPGANCSWMSGSWRITEDGCLSATEGALNRVRYDVALPRSGFHLVEFYLAGEMNLAEKFHFVLFTDDAEIDRFSDPISADGSVWRVRTPWLPEGTNRFRLAWVENDVADRYLEVERFRVIGVDADEVVARNAWCAGVSASADADGDGLVDIAEIMTTETFVTQFDSDGDGLWDGDELLIYRLNPLLADSDEDGLPDATVVSERAGVETATRTITHITTDFTEMGKSLVWAESTASSCAYDLSVVAPGFHVLEIDVRNESYDPPDGYAFEFRVSLVDREIGMFVCKGDIGHAGTARLVTPWLTAGVHRFSLSWRNRVVQDLRASRPALEHIRLIAVNGADTDGDGIQDWMKDRLMASNADSDGDGIKDRDEVLVYFSNPLSADTDGDGLNDKDELAWGTDLINPDSDGDGLSDGDEVHGAGSDPLSDEFSGVWTPIHTRAGCDTVLRDGPAYSSDGDLVLTGRGNVEYLFTLPVADKPLLRVSGRHELRTGPATGARADMSDFLVYVDGQFISRCFLHDRKSDFTAVLPFMKAGTHRVRLSWNTLNPLLSARVCNVALGSLGGADSDGDGVRDWITAAASRTNRVTVVPAASPISPVCLEGTARWPLLASAASGTETVPVHAGVAGLWFADLPLAPSGELTPLDFAFENGASTATVSVAWVPLNLLAAPDQMPARLGDTLRVTVVSPQGGSAQGSATLEITVDGVVRQTLQIQSDGMLEIPFDSDGIWTLSTVWTGTGGDRISRTLTVRVYASPLPGEPACLLGRQRDWPCPGITFGAVFQTDSGVKLAWDGTNATLTVNSMYAEHFIVARAGTGGPVLGSRRINPFWIQSAPDSFLRVVEIRGSSQVWENHVATLGLPSDVEVEIRIIVGGVTFDDLSLVRWLSGGTLPGASGARFRMIRPNSVQASTCHTIKAYQDGVFLGEAYHAGVGLPNDLR